MSKKEHKRAPKPILTTKAHAYQKHILHNIMHSPWFWSAIVFGIIFLIIFLAATVEAGIRYQGFVDTGNAFNAAWISAVKHDNLTFQVHSSVTGNNLSYWFNINWFKNSDYSWKIDNNWLLIYKNGDSNIDAKLQLLGQPKTFEFHDNNWSNEAMFYETNTFFVPFWNSEITVADNNVWDWMSQPLFGQYPYEMQSLVRGKEMPNAQIYRCLVYYYSLDNPNKYTNLSFFASLWPKSMNMNYGYWIISVTFFTAFAFSFCVFCSYMMKIRKTFKSDKKDNENTLAEYLEAEADNMHFSFQESTVSNEGGKVNVTPTN